MMTMFYKLIGDSNKLPLEYRIFNIILIFCCFVCCWSTLSNYWLNLGSLLVWASIGGIIGFSAIFLFFNHTKRCWLSISLFFATISVLFVVMWFFNGGSAGTIPIYLSLFAPLAATLFRGKWRIAAIFCFGAGALVLILIEYHYPHYVVGYDSALVRYIDISLSVITAMAANAWLFIALINQYNKERIKVKKSQEDLLYLIHHDALTGVYNRRYFDSGLLTFDEEKAGNGIFVIDIDGLKIVNDLLGHEQGDRLLISAAKVLKESFRADDAISRVGGDEFAVLLRDVTANDMEDIYKRIQKNVGVENENLTSLTIPLQMSVGYAYSSDAKKSVQDLFRDADSRMYREKLGRYAAGNGTVMQTIKQLLATRSDIRSQSDRLKKMVIGLGQAAGVSEKDLDDLALLAEFHYLGKVGISETILNKPGPLTGKERAEVQKHSEIGYRIAQNTSELAPIAEWLLKHHEWWNGEGYPLGIGRQSIPLPCRILAVVDAYEAMTSHRPYRPAMDQEEALAELLRCAGTQFDPNLVNLFIAKVATQPDL